MEEEKQVAAALRVLIVDDHPMIREGLRNMLLSSNRFYSCEVDDAEEGTEAVHKVIHKGFHLALVDYHMNGMTGDEIIGEMLRYQPELKVLAVSNYDEAGYVRKMMEAGALGYVLKNIEPPELFKAIHAIMSGTSYYSSEVAARLLETSDVPDRSASVINKYNLSDRELEVLRLIAEEKTSEEIAATLHVSKRTVDSHRYHILAKVSAKNAAGLIRVAYELRLMSKE